MASDQETVYERVRARLGQMTRAERQLANNLLEDWPVSGLTSITAIAKAADVSTPTVVRMVYKLGFGGFPEFQAALREELKAKISNPISKHDRWSSNVPGTHALSRFAEAVMQNVAQTLQHLDPVEFDLVCEKLADSSRSVYIAGGRITHTIAEYLFLHMLVIRPHVSLIPSSHNTWPHHVMDLKKGDVLIVFDIRRYQNDLLQLAELAKSRQVELVLFTDQWGSPVARHAAHHFNCRIEVPSAWDSSATLLMLVETLISQVEKATWQSTAERMKDLEVQFDKTRLFRKFT